MGQLLLQLNRMKDKHEARRFQGISPAGAISAWKGSDISNIRVAGGTRRKGERAAHLYHVPLRDAEKGKLYRLQLLPAAYCSPPRTILMGCKDNDPSRESRDIAHHLQFNKMDL